MTTPATTRIATCYNPSHEPGTRRLIEIRRDNTADLPARRYVVAQVYDGISEHHVHRHTESAALEYAAELGYTEVVAADEPPTAYKITGRPAIAVAEMLGLTLEKYADPTDDTQTRAAGLSVSDARAIAAEDPSLIWVDTAAVAESIDDERIRALRREAITAGDMRQMLLCDVALGLQDGDREESRARCAAVIAGVDRS